MYLFEPFITTYAYNNNDQQDPYRQFKVAESYFSCQSLNFQNHFKLGTNQWLPRKYLKARNWIPVLRSCQTNNVCFAPQITELFYPPLNQYLPNVDKTKNMAKQVFLQNPVWNDYCQVKTGIAIKVIRLFDIVKLLSLEEFKARFEQDPNFYLLVNMRDPRGSLKSRINADPGRFKSFANKDGVISYDKLRSYFEKTTGNLYRLFTGTYIFWTHTHTNHLRKLPKHRHKTETRKGRHRDGDIETEIQKRGYKNGDT